MPPASGSTPAPRSNQHGYSYTIQTAQTAHLRYKVPVAFVSTGQQLR